VTASESEPRRTDRFVAHRLVGLLPAPRDVALIEVGRALRDLLAGREPRASRESRRAALAEQKRRLESARSLLAKGDPDAARAEIARAEQSYPDDPALAAVRSTADRSAPIRGRVRPRPPIEADIAVILDHLRALGPRTPTLLLFHQASPDNPFQALLYRRAWEHGVAATPLWDLEDLDRVPSSVPPDVRLVLHLHWVNRVLAGARDVEDANERLAAFAARLDRALEAGIRIVWTAHNVLPHDTAMEAADAELRRIIIDRASMVHVLAASTSELAAPSYTIPPEKVVHVPLPGFRGAYPDYVDRQSARYALGLPADAYVIALVGGLRPHKGLESLLDAVDLAATDEPKLRLIVAGAPGRDEAVEAFLRRAEAHPRVNLHARSIPGEDMQLFLRASDAAILPYLRTLNSAVLMMVLAFELPVIAPPVGGIGETIEPSVSVTFTAGDTNSLASAILASRDLPRDEVRAAARRITDEHDPDALSNRFMSALLEAIDSRRAP